MNSLRLYIRKIINETIEVGTVKITQEDLVQILKGYLEAAIWTEEENLLNHNSEEDDVFADDEDNSDTETKKFTIDDLEDNSKIQAYMDIKKFMKNAGKDAIDEAIEENGLFRLGMDIWLTRNHHGSGFFDHGYYHEEELTKSAQSLKGVDLYLGDDMQVYFSNID
jgi:hypothetical protein